MPEPLTLERFEQFVETYTENHGGLVKRLDRIETRLGNIETLLWQGQRIEEIEQRLVDLAKATGHGELARPFVPSPGMAQPAE